MAEKGEKERALVRERVIYALIMQQPRFITSDTRCLADSGIARSIDRRTFRRTTKVPSRTIKKVERPLGTFSESQIAVPYRNCEYDV